jgi:hypothetical protein
MHRSETKIEMKVKILCNKPFFFSYSGGGVQLGPLGTAVTDWPIVPASGDYDGGEFGGMKIGRGNRSTKKNRHSATLSTTNPT